MCSHILIHKADAPLTLLVVATVIRSIKDNRIKNSVRVRDIGSRPKTYGLRKGASNFDFVIIHG